MSIDKLSSTASIVAALRAEASRRSGRTDWKAGHNVGDASRDIDARNDVSALRKQLVELVRSASLRDPAEARSVRLRVVRAILLWELGAELREHPEWQPMLESIVGALEGHGEFHSRFLEFISELKS